MGTTRKSRPVPKALVPVAIAAFLVMGAVAAVGAQDERFACEVSRTVSTLDVTWDAVTGADSYQYKLSVPGEGNRYRRVGGTSLSLDVTDPTSATIAMTPVKADGSSPSRVICSDAAVVRPPTTSADTACSLAPTSGGVTLRWDPIPGATGYQYRVESAGGNRYRSADADATEVFIPTEGAVAVDFRPYFDDRSVARRSCGSASPNGAGSSTSTTQPEAPQPSAPPTVPDTTLANRVFVSADSPITSNFSSAAPDNGPQCVSPGNVSNNPGLRYGEFLLKNSAWNAGAAAGDFSQCIQLVTNDDGSVSPQWSYDWLAETEVNGSIYQVRSFPEVIYGTKAAFETSAIPDVTGLPARYGELPQFQIDYDYEITTTDKYSKVVGGETINAEHNVTIESFFHTDCDIRRGSSGSNREFEVMLWLEHEERDPFARSGYQGIFPIDGADYEVWTKAVRDPGYIAFVALDEQRSGSINWTALIEWARENGPRYGTREFDDSWCLANIITGTEIWWGEGTFQLNQLDITRTYN